MKKILLFVILFITSMNSYSREVYDFNNDWKFSESFTLDSDQKSITLPHVWGVVGDNQVSDKLYRGACYYSKEFRVPSSFSGKDIYLRFGGVGSVATVYVNGKYVTEHKGAYTAFNVDITPFVRVNELNSITVVVSNAPRIDVLPFMSENHIFGGIYSPVQLIVVEKTHFSLTHYGSKGVYLRTKNIFPSSASIDVILMVKGEASSVVNVEVNVYSEGESVTKSVRSVRLDGLGESRVTMPITITNPQLWQAQENPFLYDVATILRVDDKICDSLMTPLGIRDIEINSKNQFVINDKVLELRGVNIFQDNARVGSAYRSVDFTTDISLIKEMGANSVRNHGGAHSYEAFKLYDEYGLIAWVDLPFSSDIIYGGKGFADIFYQRENGKEQLLEMIYQLYNHPSVCFWGVFNEISARGDNPLDYIKELNDICLELSPDRITVGSSIEDGRMNRITQAISWPIYFGWNKSEISDFKVWIKMIETDYRDLKSAISEYGSAADINTFITSNDQLSRSFIKGNDTKTYPQNSQSLFHEGYYASICESPIFWGTYINSMFDYLSPDSDGYIKDGNNNMGLVSYDRSVRKDAFYFYKANWNKQSKFIHIANKDYSVRTDLTHTIKAYTNLSTAKLIVNGELVGEGESELGVVVWKDVKLKRGNNRILVANENISDITEIDIYDSLLAQ